MTIKISGCRLISELILKGWCKMKQFWKPKVAFGCRSCAKKKKKLYHFVGYLACKDDGPLLEDPKATKPCPEHGIICNGTNNKCPKCMAELRKMNERASKVRKSVLKLSTA